MMVRRKIVFVHHCGTKSGAGNSLKTLIKNLDSDKFDLIILCPKGSAFTEFLKISENVYEIPELPEVVSISGYSYNYLRLLKAFMLFKNIKQVVSLIKNIRPDIVHLNEVSLTPLAKYLKKSNFKIVIHARLVLSHKTPLLNKFIVTQVNKFCGAVICIDESVRNMLKKVNNSSVVYNSYEHKAVDIPKYPTNKFIVLFLANLIKYKGVFDLIKAAKLIGNDSEIEIHIAGTNSRPDFFFKSFKGKVLNFVGIVKNNKKALEKEIHRNRLDSTVKLIGNISNIQDKISHSSVNIFPSYMNGPSRSIFECGILGRPSIIALHDKIEDVVENGVTGFVIDEKSPKQIAETILKLKNTEGLLAKLGRSSREKYVALNDPIRNAQKVQTIYENLLR